MDICEIWSISIERIAAFLSSHDEVLTYSGDHFSFRGCDISLAVLPDHRVGSFLFPRTQVCFSGPASDTEEIHRRFVLQFISAGG